MSAPQVTPADVEATIASEHYFTGAEGFVGAVAQKVQAGAPVNMTAEQVVAVIDGPLSGLMVCVLVLKNGHLVTGEALLQDLSKPAPERARASARRRAFDKAYDMVVYAERERLAAAKDQIMPAVGAAWTVIDRSTPSLSEQTLPPKGDWLVTVDTDSGREVHTLEHEGGGNWRHEGEYTFQHGYYFRPIAWAPRPEAYSAPVPSED